MATQAANPEQFKYRTSPTAIEAFENWLKDHAPELPVHTHPRDHIGAPILSVNRAMYIDHDALGIGQDGEITDVGNGPRQINQHGLCSLYQGSAGLLHSAHVLGRNRIKTNSLCRMKAHRKATLP